MTSLDYTVEGEGEDAPADDAFVLPPLMMADLPAFYTEADYNAFLSARGIPADAPAWWDGQTEVPEGYLWPWQLEELRAQAEHDAFQFTEQWWAEAMAAFHALREAPLAPFDGSLS